MNIKFLNPFNGKPKPIPLKDLLLYDPDVMLAFDDIYLSRIFADGGHQSLFKRFTAISKGVTPVENAKSLLDEMAVALGIPEKLMEALRQSTEVEEQLLAGASIDDVDLSKRIGLHEAGTLGSRLANPEFTLDGRHAFLFAVERASFPIDWAIVSGDIKLAIQKLKGDELLSQFLWPEMNAALERVSDKPHLKLHRVLISLEVYGHFLAVLELYLENKYHVPARSALMDVWPEQNSKKNPTALLFQWMKRHADMRSIGAILGHPKLVNESFEETTLKRWSAGSHHPNGQRLAVVVAALFGQADYRPFWGRHHMARMVNFLGYVHASILSNIPADVSEELRLAMEPWPSFPHNHPDFASWGRARYPAWREFASNYQPVYQPK